MLSAFGSNGSGQLGLGHDEDVHDPSTTTIQENYTLARPQRIAAGGNHTSILSADGAVFAAGDNSNGRCAFGTALESSSQFRPCSPAGSDSSNPITTCAATWEASVFASDRQVFTCGTGAKGELGQGENTIESAQAQPIPDFPPPDTRVIDMAAGMNHVVAVLDNGDVYGWGNGRKGQFGEATSIVWSPRKLSGISFPVCRAVCGREFTFVIGDPSQGQCAVLGADKWSIASAAPKSVPGYIDVGAGWSNIYILQQDGSILAWGRNNHGQLPPSNVPPIEAIAAGSEHVLAKTRDGKVLAWGWGEHGNCGLPIDDSGNVAGRWNEIQTSGPVEFIAAGCATSFIFTS
ncbi:regulator of chromosome condensation 1/beta-lactamase-inhibitor protein II [Phyllosticta capitalensis]|uniref:Regulator of chromosome condensation 1/beta-lactamase-inhibitor protein II n=1 Tax=Phyllosticta capitalensis TaxID=121624 RepID=A0ABR1YTL1_9PEZI